MEYDFSQLNDKEFEILVADLLGQKFGVKFERFKAGKDGGVDARAFTSSGGEIVVQCKHYLRTGVSSLLKTMGSTELPKMLKINPKHYIIVTSCPLSRTNKDQLSSIFRSVGTRQSDIFGQEDLNDLLRLNPEVETRHPKLWISSSTVLQRILNNDILGRSEYFIKQISRKSKLFVVTADFEKAYERIEESNVLILSGEPGVGKTTLAENLCLIYAAKDFQVIDIIKDLSEGEAVYDLGERQIFIFDDFLGSNYLEAIYGREDSHVVKFIKRVSADKNKRFVLTTRTHILNQAVTASDVLKSNNVRRNEILLEVSHLSRVEKAKILYSHIWHSGLESEFIDEFYKDKRYFQIIDHKNFNPRIIEFITDRGRQGFPDSSGYLDFILGMLDKPSSIWENAFWNQGNDDIRSLVKMVALGGGSLSEFHLEAAFRRQEIQISKGIRIDLKNRFKKSLEAAAKSFLVREISHDKHIKIILFNPSVTDFVISEFRADEDELVKTFSALENVDSIHNLQALQKQEIISTDLYERIMDAIDHDTIREGKSVDYRIRLTELLSNPQKKKERAKEILLELSSSPIKFNQKSNFLRILLEYSDIIINSDFNFLIKCFSGDSLDFYEVLALAEVMFVKDVDENSDIYFFWIEQLEELVDQASADIAADLPIEEYIEHYSSYEGDYDTKVNRDGLKDKLLSEIEDYFEDFPDIFQDVISDRINDVLRNFDYDDLVGGWMKSQSGGYEGRRYSSGQSGGAAEDSVILDLFERG